MRTHTHTIGRRKSNFQKGLKGCVLARILISPKAKKSSDCTMTSHELKFVLILYKKAVRSISNHNRRKHGSYWHDETPCKMRYGQDRSSLWSLANDT